MTRYLLERPHQLVSLTFFAARYESAKSSISEDLTILKRTFQNRGTGLLETVPGAAGGARFIPYILREEAEHFVEDMIDELSAADRYLPGGYVYMSDILGRPAALRQIGRILATQYLNQNVDVVVTVATKGIPLARVWLIIWMSHLWLSGTIHRLQKARRSVWTMFLARLNVLNGWHSLSEVWNPIHVY